jgi:hypothetical protein
MKLEDVLAGALRDLYRTHKGMYEFDEFVNEHAAAMLATSEGKALAALVEAAVAWTSTEGWSSDAALRQRLDSDLGLAVAEYLRLGDVA